MNNLIVLAYHSISPTPYSESDCTLTVRPNEFKKQIQYLIRKGYRNISASELHVSPLSKEKRFLITFDDGYEDNYLYAFPIIKELNCTALIFYTCNALKEQLFLTADKKSLLPFLTKAQILEMSNYGIEFGSHTFSHPHLPKLNQAELINEICDSKDTLKTELGIDINHFCAPYGEYTKEAIQLSQSCYDLVFLTYAYRTIYANEERVVSRIGVYWHNSFLNFKIKVIRDTLRVI